MEQYDKNQTFRAFSRFFSKKSLDKRKGAIMYWTLFCSGMLFIYHYYSDQDFSFIFTASSLCRAFAFLILLLKMRSQKTCAGISLKTMYLYAIVFFFRAGAILFYEGYLPVDKSGDILPYVECLSLGMSMTVAYFMLGPMKATYDKEQDSFRIEFLIIPCAVLALLLHPDLNRFMPADMSWAFACYLEAVSILPQLLLLQKMGEVEALTSHYVFALGFSRLLNFIFWLWTFQELMRDSDYMKAVGITVLIAEALHLLLMADFFYHYIVSMRKGVRMVLPGSTV